MIFITFWTQFPVKLSFIREINVTENGVSSNRYMHQIT
mgnify:CR=1 FL=1